MADPTLYVPGYSYSGWQASNPAKPLPAPQVDNDLANISRSINEMIGGLKDVRRSDGALANQSVGPDQLSSALTIGFTMRGAWLDGASYGAGDGVVYEAAFYSARVAHTADSDKLPTDPAYWNFLFSIDDLVIAGALSAPVDNFTGDGVTKEFTLSFVPVSERNLWVLVGGLLQEVGEYTIEGSKLIMLDAPADGYKVQVRGFATTTSVVEPTDGSVSFEKLTSGVADAIADKGAGGYTQIDFLNSADPNSAFSRFNLTKQGSGSGNVVQSFVEDQITFSGYSMHSYSVGDTTIINKFAAYGPATQTSVRWTKTPDAQVGHQGLTLERTPTGGRRFWASASYNIANSKSKVVRFSISDDGGDATGLLIGDVEIFTLFDDATGDGSCTPTISSDGRYLVAKQNMTGNIMRVRVWELAVLLAGGPGNYSASYVYQFDVPDFYDPTNYPVQGLCCDGAYIYAIAGYGDSTGAYANKKLAKLSLDGTSRLINPTFKVGLTEALGDGAGDHYEPEGIYIARHGGRDVIAVNVSSGDAGARVNRVYYLDGDHMVTGRGVGTRPGFFSTGVNDFGWPVGDVGRFGSYDSNPDSAGTFTEALTFETDGKASFARATSGDGASYSVGGLIVGSIRVATTMNFHIGGRNGASVWMSIGATDSDTLSAKFGVDAATGAFVPFTDLAYTAGLATKRPSNTFTQLLTLIDGVTAPATVAGHAVLYVDSADGDLKIKFGDGTVKTIVTDT